MHHDDHNSVDDHNSSDADEAEVADGIASLTVQPYTRDLNDLRNVYKHINALCERFPNGQGLSPQHAQHLLELGDSLYDAWMTPLKSMNATDMSMFSLIMFGFGEMEDQAGMDYNMLVQNYSNFIKPVILLQRQITVLLKLNETENVLDAETMQSLTDMNTNRLILVKHVIVRLKHHIESMRACHTLSRISMISELGQMSNTVDASFLESNQDRMAPVHHLIVYIANRLYAHQFRRFNNRCYEQKYVTVKAQVLNRNGHLARSVSQRMPTRYWKENCTLEEFINRQCDKENNFDYWSILTGSRDMTARLVNHFCCPGGGEMEFPELQVNRHWFAFAEGIYNCDDQQFYPYDETHLLPQKDKASQACINLFENVKFNVELMKDDVDSLEKIMDVPTPVFDSIFKHQKMERDVIKWVYVLFGRMFYELHMWDKWQVVAFVKGLAGTGKSTLGNLLLRIFPQEFVGNLSSNVEKQFGLEALVDRLIWICFEVKSDFQLKLSELQSMISGELVQVARKFKGPSTVRWNSPGMMFGNEVPPWKDVAGALMRRFVLLMFDQKVDENLVNSNLLDELCAELGTIIPKVTMMYRRVAYEGGSKDLWHFLPEYFKITRRKFLTSTSPIATFLEETALFEKCATECVLLQDFSLHFLEWMKQNRPADRLINVTPEVYSTPFQHNGLSVRKSERMWGGVVKTGDFIFGLKMNGQVH